MVNNEEKKKKDLKVMSHIIIWVVIFCMIFATDKSYRGTGIFLFGILMTYYFLVALFLNKKKLREAERELDKKVLEYKEECNKKIFSLKKEIIDSIDELEKIYRDKTEEVKNANKYIDEEFPIVMSKFNDIKEHNDLVNSINSLKSEKEKLNDEIQLRMSAINESDGIESFIKRISGLKLELSQLEEKENLNNLAFYEKKYEFENSYIYKTELDRIRSEQKIMMRIDSAIRYYEDSLGYQNAKFLKKVKKQIGNLMLRAFNVESDLLISMVNYKNIATMENKIRKSHDTINKFGESFGLEIEYDYLQLKMQELILNHEYKEKEEEEKQEQREILEQMREEEKAQREMERELAKTRREEERYQNALDDAKKDLEFTQDVERTKLLAKIELLERNLLEAQEKERMISQAQLTKVGHVYVISNVGSFGENIFKIGMTRRLEPTDRVNELSNASVPFPFDVHAMLFSENAPELEKKLQKEFEEHRVNKVNCRKEFFKVSLEDIERKARQHKADIRFTKLAEAKQYRETKALEQREIN